MSRDTGLALIRQSQNLSSSLIQKRLEARNESGRGSRFNSHTWAENEASGGLGHRTEGSWTSGMKATTDFQTSSSGSHQRRHADMFSTRHRHTSSSAPSSTSSSRVVRTTMAPTGFASMTRGRSSWENSDDSTNDDVSSTNDHLDDPGEVEMEEESEDEALTRTTAHINNITSKIFGMKSRPPQPQPADPPRPTPQLLPQPIRPIVPRGTVAGGVTKRRKSTPLSSSSAPSSPSRRNSLSPNSRRDRQTSAGAPPSPAREPSEDDRGGRTPPSSPEMRNLTSEARRGGGGSGWIDEYLEQIPQDIRPQVDFDVSTPYGTLTLAKPTNELMERAEAYFKCGISNVRDCKGCETKITDQATAELQPEMCAMMMGFLKNWGHSDIFYQCEEASRFFNTKVIPIYNARLNEMQQEAIRSDRAAPGNTSVRGDSNRYLERALRTMTADQSSDQGGGTPADNTAAAGAAGTSSSNLQQPKTPEEMAAFVNRLLNSFKKPLTEWTPRSVFDHFVLHVCTPMVTELVILMQLRLHIQTLDGLIFIKLPGPNGTEVKEVMHKTADTWQKFIKSLSAFNDRLQGTLKEGAHVTSALAQGLSAKAIVSNAWSTPYTAVSTVKDLYTSS